METVDCVVSEHKKECSGCYACFNACPVQAISMQTDAEGFWYPVVDGEKCVHCGRCRKVCQIFNEKKAENTIPTEAFACINQDTEERLASSSGGLFILLAQYVLNQGGVVFGAAFDEHMELRHTYATDQAGCEAFMGSKYLQSRIGSAYAEAKRFLTQGRWVLFTGTPCQIHGLKLFLGREYEKLIAVDLACHGVPSPAVFKKYLSDLEKELGSPVIDFRFRSKKTGWNNFASEVHFESGDDSVKPHNDCPFVCGFLANLYLRPSCYHCKNKGDNRYADLTLGDYWGIESAYPELADDQGTSILFVRTEKGKGAVQAISSNLRSVKTDASYGQRSNIAISRPVDVNPKRTAFFRNFNSPAGEQKTLKALVDPFIPKPSLALQLRMMIPRPAKLLIKRILKGNRGGIRTEGGKGISWKLYSQEVFFDNGQEIRMPHSESAFMQGFLSDIYLRPSCYACQNKGEHRFSDLTLADYWGVEVCEPDMDDDQGTSAVLVHTEKGAQVLEQISGDVTKKKTSLAYVYRCNPSLVKNARELAAGHKL